MHDIIFFFFNSSPLLLIWLQLKSNSSFVQLPRPDHALSPPLIATYHSFMLPRFLSFQTYVLIMRLHHEWHHGWYIILTQVSSLWLFAVLVCLYLVFVTLISFNMTDSEGCLLRNHCWDLFPAILFPLGLLCFRYSKVKCYARGLKVLLAQFAGTHCSGHDGGFHVVFGLPWCLNFVYETRSHLTVVKSPFVSFL